VFVGVCRYEITKLRQKVTGSSFKLDELNHLSTEVFELG